MDPPLLSFAGCPCRVQLARYQHGDRLAIRLVDTQGGFPVATASVNVPDEPMDADEVAIKTWSENQSILPVLIAAGIVAPPHRYIAAGDITRVPVCRFVSAIRLNG